MKKIVGIVAVFLNKGTEALPDWLQIKTVGAYREDEAFEVARSFPSDEYSLGGVYSGKHYWIAEIKCEGEEDTPTYGLEAKLGPPISVLNGGANGFKATLKDEDGNDVVHTFGNVWVVGKRLSKPEAPGVAEVIYTLNAKSRSVS